MSKPLYIHEQRIAHKTEVAGHADAGYTGRLGQPYTVDLLSLEGDEQQQEQACDQESG